MDVVCLDMEGVVVPEIWIAFAEASGIPELKRTTRDEPDYDKLMRWRLGPSQIKSVQGFGEANPVASNATAAGQKENRRVEVYMYASQAMVEAANNGTLQ